MVLPVSSEIIPLPRHREFGPKSLRTLGYLHACTHGRFVTAEDLRFGWNPLGHWWSEKFWTFSELHRFARGRAGNKTGFQRLSDLQRIKFLYWTGAKTQSEIAKEFSLSRVTVSRIVHGHAYWWAGYPHEETK